MLFFHVLLARNAGADRINLNGEITYQDIDTTTTTKTTGEKLDTNSYLIRQRYNLDLSKTIYPYLSFDTGTIFELNETTSKTEGTKTEIDERLLQPFVRLSLDIDQIGQQTYIGRVLLSGFKGCYSRHSISKLLATVDYNRWLYHADKLNGPRSPGPE